MARPPNIDIRQLRYFCAIVEVGSINRAAKFLHIAQPALSKRITDLEEELDTQLINRGRQGVRVTAQGEMLYKFAQRILRELEITSDLVRTLGKAPSGQVVMGFIRSPMPVIGGPVIDALLQKYPAIRPVLVTGNSIDLDQRLRAGELDLCLTVRDSSVQDFASQLLLQEEMFVVANGKENDFDIGSISLEELASCAFILPRASNYSVRNVVSKLFDQIVKEPEIRAEIEDSDLISELVKKGHGYTVMPWSVASRYVGHGISLKRIPGIEMHRELGLYGPMDHVLTPAAMAARDVTIQIIRQLIKDQTWKYVSLTKG